MAQAGNAYYDSPRDIPAIIPIFPLEEVLLLPRTQMPLNIFEDRYIAMIEHAMKTDRIIGMIQPLKEEDADSTGGERNGASMPPELQRVGCLGRISAYGETGDGRVLITLAGICRFRLIRELETDTLFRLAEVDCENFAEDLIEGFGEESVDRDGLLEMFRAFLDANDMEADWDNVAKSSNEILVNSLSMMSPYGLAEKQALLEAESLSLRAETLIAITEMHLATGDNDGPTTLQ
ncbi:LON peptidase substrate-binding domain-containing protein [uncultured Cohaesibacter sp.]|uniref:LON peptidase substrate-binding domain-containing protein n=1 Tax=uncultured Cohaesibacter sp. TaxID=1002546 RepID=UPI0029C8A388|nr:LON peptidase substrate-binding domain-containing protein [uncultured Cohaesibacter sp.]